jgi:hypothetical protein
MNEEIIDESSMVHIERKSLTVLKRKQDELFINENSEYVNLEEIVNESELLNNSSNVRVVASLGRNIFNLRKNYLKIRIKSTNSERYINTTEIVDERLNSLLQSLDYSINVEITILYPENYPYISPQWEIEKYHGHNINSDIVKNKLEDLIIEQNRKNMIDWSPVNKPSNDIINFLRSMNSIWCLMGRVM